ncbi:MAG: hypothetical protein ABH832_02280 [bacterium]
MSVITNSADQDLKERYDRLSLLYLKFRKELDEISEKEDRLARKIDQAIDHEKMHTVLKYIKNIKQN